MLCFSCMGELRYFFLISSEIVHLFVVLRCLFEASLCIVLPPQPTSGFLQWQGYWLGYEALREPLLFCCPADWWAPQTLLVPRQFLPSSISVFAPSQVTLLWATASVGCNCSGTHFGVWLPGLALHSWPSGTEWYWRRKTCSGDLILQKGRSPSPPLDCEYHLLILSLGGLSGQKPPFTPCEGLWLVTIYGQDSTKSAGKVEARLQVLCLYGYGTSSSVWALKKAFKSLTLLQVWLTAQSPAMGGIRQPS